MVDKSTNDKKPEETVTVEEEDLFEDFPLGKGKSQCPVGFELLLARMSMLRWHGAKTIFTAFTEQRC